MTTITINGKEYNVKFGYEATVKNGIIKKLIEIEQNSGDSENVEQLLTFLPELFLVGLQKYHYDEFGFNAYDAEQKEKALSKVYALLDDYFDSDDGDLTKIYADLQKELIENGFLSKMLQKAQEQAKSKANMKKLKEAVKN